MLKKIEDKKVVNDDRLKVANLNRLNKTTNMLSSKNRWFYLSIILVNIVILAVSVFVESNKNGVARGVFKSFNYRYLYLLLMSIMIIVLLIVIPNYIFLYKKTKQRLFWSVLVGNIMRGFYNCLICSVENTNSLYVENLKCSKVSDDTSKEMMNTDSVACKIANTIYWLVVVGIGSFFVFKKLNLFLIIGALFGLFINVCVVLLILYFERFKAKYLIIIGKLCKFLYRIKLIKNYEKLYNVLVVKLIQYGSVLKGNKLYLICQIICSIFVKFAIHLLLFFIISVFNISSFELLFEILCKCSMLDIIIGLLPVPKGMLFYENLFLIFFRDTLFEGYIVYILVAYRFIIYFLIQLVFGVFYLIGGKRRMMMIDKQIIDEVNFYK